MGAPVCVVENFRLGPGWGAFSMGPCPQTKVSSRVPAPSVLVPVQICAPDRPPVRHTYGFTLHESHLAK